MRLRTLFGAHGLRHRDAGAAVPAAAVFALARASKASFAASGLIQRGNELELGRGDHVVQKLGDAVALLDEKRIVCTVAQAYVNDAAVVLIDDAGVRGDPLLAERAAAVHNGAQVRRDRHAHPSVDGLGCSGSNGAVLVARQVVAAASGGRAPGQRRTQLERDLHVKSWRILHRSDSTHTLVLYAPDDLTAQRSHSIFTPCECDVAYMRLAAMAAKTHVLHLAVSVREKTSACTMACSTQEVACGEQCTHVLSVETAEPTQKQRQAKFVTDIDVDQGLISTGQLHNDLGKRMEALKGRESASVVSVSLTDLKRMRKMAGKANRSISKFARRSFETEDRLCLEIQLLRHAAHRDRIDNAAHKARIFERLRTFEGKLNSESTGNSVLHGSSTTLVDRSLAFCNNVDASLNDLSPVTSIPAGGQGMMHSANTSRAVS